MSCVESGGGGEAETLLRRRLIGRRQKYLRIELAGTDDGLRGPLLDDRLLADRSSSSMDGTASAVGAMLVADSGVGVCGIVFGYVRRSPAGCWKVIAVYAVCQVYECSVLCAVVFSIYQI